ncbi:hypothetical protein BJ875DRAFT_443723 [Amylocarpus encephaloides]|uniref:Plastocyanin-like domain-containing protein n=1 Tax=Amylocarpus encephaloides TaxID=45428 RepID=A0A9P8C375_9HELO|nr:hypothetical protein BJ875DRAFT_443723 [Amylocarpus encephaloides]
MAIELDSEGFINQTSWEITRPRKPPLTALERLGWGDSFIPYIQSGESQWVDIIPNNFDDRGHPFHLHGKDFLVLSTYQAGIGGYDEAYNPFDSSKPPAGAADERCKPDLERHYFRACYSLRHIVVSSN